MGSIYRYIDVSDKIIKYVGIVYDSDRLERRIKEHKRDAWHKNKVFRVEVLDFPIQSKTDLEFMEAHFIALYQTGEFYNRAKTNGGISQFIPDMENLWHLYDKIPFVYNKIV